MEMQRKYLKLMEYEKAFIIQMMPPPCTITFLQGDKSLIVDGLKSKVNEII
jgi:hypothetical protein